MPAWAQAKEVALAAAATAAQDKAATDTADLLFDLGTKVKAKAKDKDSQKVKRAKAKAKRAATDKKGDAKELISESSEECSESADE